MIYLDHTIYKDKTKNELIDHSKDPYDTLKWIKTQTSINAEYENEPYYHEMFIIDDEFNTLGVFKGTIKECAEQMKVQYE